MRSLSKPSPAASIAILVPLLGLLAFQSCKPRVISALPVVETAPVPPPLTLADLVDPELRVIGLPIQALWRDDTLQLSELCELVFHYPLLDGQEAFNGRIDTMVQFQKADFQLGCAPVELEEGEEELYGEGYLWAEEGVIGENWVSVLVEFDNRYPGGKSHPIARSLNYHPPSGTWLEPQDVFELEPDSTYRLLRRLVLKKIKAEKLLENAEATLFDNGAQETEEVFSAFIRTEQGLVFVFGPGQCYQMYWSGNMQVLLEWETPIE